MTIVARKPLRLRARRSCSVCMRVQCHRCWQQPSGMPVASTRCSMRHGSYTLVGHLVAEVEPGDAAARQQSRQRLDSHEARLACMTQRIAFRV